jgi:ADP-ribosylglycohydrolase
MRAAPLGLISDHRLRATFATLIADCTHRHETARVAAFVVGTAAFFFACTTNASDQLIRYCLEQLKLVGWHDNDVATHLCKVDALDNYHDYGGIEHCQLDQLLGKSLIVVVVVVIIVVV